MNRTLLIHPLPFIVVTRQQDSLLRRLVQDDYPILFEGKHTTYYLDHPDLEERKKYVRTHNIEADYYAGLARTCTNPMKRWYFKKESKKLRTHQVRLKAANHLFSISHKDVAHFSNFNSSISHLPPFHANDEGEFHKKKENYCLYHGNLSVGENEEAALYLIEKVFDKSAFSLIIFGNIASAKLCRAADKRPNVTLISGSHEELEPLVQKAQINILPTFQSTGMKLKLLYSLFNGGHILVNDKMVTGTGTESLVTIAEDASDFRLKLETLMSKEFTEADFQSRKKFLESEFSNKKQAQVIIDQIFGKQA